MTVNATHHELSRWFDLLRGRSADGLIGLALVAAVVVMVAPMAPWVMDLLLGLNLGGAVLLVCLALLLRHPVSFSALPSLLLVATLFRLSLNVASTRLILTRADAGRIIAGFGSVVVGGDILVGVVIFGIVALVLFLVITKGAERVAEVAARFSLDALPGLQLAIDADARGGALTAQEAKQRRAELDRQSRYHGALDGAMKFVRGDAVAILAILCINLIGGVAVGMLRRGLSPGDALSLYGSLTVGDGLVSLLPALLTATAAGLLVTRVGQGDDGLRLGAQLERSLRTEPRALLVAAMLMAALALLPGLPAWPFLLVGALLSAGYAAVRRDRPREAAQTPHRDAAFWEHPCVALRMGRDLAARCDARRLESFVREQVVRSLGPVLEEVLVSLDNETGPDRLRLELKGLFVAEVQLGRDVSLCLAPARIIRRIGLSAERRLAGGYLVEKSDAAIARAAGHEVVTGEELVARVACHWLQGRAAELVTIDVVGRLVEALASQRPRLVRETVPRRVSLVELGKLLGELAEEGLGTQYLERVLEAVALEPKEPAGDLLERVRARLRVVITAAAARRGEEIEAISLGPQTESVLCASLRRGGQAPRLVLPADQARELSLAVEAAKDELSSPVLLVPTALRRPLWQLLWASGCEALVLSPGELEPRAAVRVVTTVEL